MKRILTLGLALFSAFGLLDAQEAFKHLSLGIDLSTAGTALQLSTPVLTDHLVLKAGASVNVPLDVSFSASAPMDQLNSRIGEINAELESISAPERINTHFSDLTVSATPVLNMSNAMLLLEYYPFTKSSFHITCGAYFGLGKDLVKANAAIGQQFFDEYDQLSAEVSALNEKYQIVPGYTEQSLPNSFKGNIGNRTLEFNTTDKKSIDLALGIAAVRPYLGLGFGRSIPKSALGVQFDLGAWYHGIPTIASSNEVPFDAEAQSLTDFDLSIIDKAVFYPVVSFKIIYKIL